MTDVMLPIQSSDLSPTLTVALAITVTAVMLLGILGLGRLILPKPDPVASSANQTPNNSSLALALTSVRHHRQWRAA